MTQTQAEDRWAASGHGKTQAGLLGQGRQRKLASSVPEAQDGANMAKVSQRIGDGCGHSFRTGHRIQCAGQEADVAS
ncbi:hypothetical protein D9M68_708310 [compost metagenome]